MLSSLFIFPRSSIRKCILLERPRLHRDAVAWLCRRQVTSVSNNDGIQEMLMKMIDKLDLATLQGSADGYVVKDRKMLHVFAEPDTARVRTDGNAEFGRQQEHGDHLINAGEPAAIDLAKVDRPGL